MHTHRSARSPGAWYLTLLLLLGASGAHAQTLRGYVGSTHDDALVGVHVTIPALGRGTVTDLEGRYALADLPPGEHVVRLSYVGFRAEERRVRIGVEGAFLEVTMQPDVLGLEAATVESAELDRDLMASSQAVAVLTVEELEEHRGQTLGETLKAIPGVTTMETGPAVSKPVVRGLRGERVVIVNAGIRQEGQQWGDEHAPEIDPFAPAQIEVLKGAAGVEYGAGAIGGVIRLKPPELPAAPGVGGTASINGFSNNRQGAGALRLEGAPERMPGMAWRLQGSVRRAGDARAPGYVIGNTGFAQQDGALTLGYERGGLRSEVYLSRFHTQLGVYQGSHIGNLSDLERAIERGEPAVDYTFGYGIDSPKQEVTHDVASVRTEYRTEGGARLEAQAGVQRNVRREYDAHRRFGDESRLRETPAIDLRLLAYTAELRYRHRPVGNWTGVIGLSGLRQGNVNREQGYLIPNFRAYTGGAYARETWVSDRWMVDAGLRFNYRWMRAHPRIDGDYERRYHSFANLDVAAGVIYQMARTWSVAVNAGTAWRPPGVNELYNEGVHHGSARFEIGDPDLGAEQSLNLDATLRHVADRLRLEVSAYANLMRDFIYLFPAGSPTLTIRGAFPTFAYRQDDALLHGIDGGATWTPSRGYELGVTASLVRGRNLDENQALIYMPAERMTVRARRNLPDGPLLADGYLEIRSRLVGRQDRAPEDADYAPPPPGYTLFDAGLGGRLQLGPAETRIVLQVQNLFDTAYRDYLSRFRYFVDEPGRSFILRVSVPFGEAM